MFDKVMVYVYEVFQEHNQQNTVFFRVIHSSQL